MEKLEKYVKKHFTFDQKYLESEYEHIIDKTTIFKYDPDRKSLSINYAIYSDYYYGNDPNDQIYLSFIEYVEEYFKETYGIILKLCDAGYIYPQKK